MSRAFNGGRSRILRWEGATEGESRLWASGWLKIIRGSPAEKERLHMAGRWPLAQRTSMETSCRKSISPTTSGRIACSITVLVPVNCALPFSAESRR